MSRVIVQPSLLANNVYDCIFCARLFPPITEKQGKILPVACASGGPLSEDRLASEIGIFFLAGFETTGHSGAWLLYLVSQNPQVEAKICQELDEHGLLVTADRPNPRKVTYEDLSKLNYLDMAIKVRCQECDFTKHCHDLDEWTPVVLNPFFDIMVIGRSLC